MRRPATSSMTTGHAHASRLTRRAFLRASALAAGLGCTALAGCDASPVADSHSISISISAPPADAPALVLPAGLGVNLHPTRVARAQIAQLAALGFRVVRLDLLWDQIERRRGHYDFSTYEPLLNALRASGVRPLCLLAYGNALYEPTSAPPSTVAGLHTDAARQAFARFAAATVAHFKGRGIIWELWNEPDNPQFWEPAASPAEYMALANLAVPAIRRSDPSATIALPALIGLEPRYQAAWDFLARCLDLGLLELADAISVHPYRLGAPESATADYQRLRTLLARHAPQARSELPILNTEWGYSLAWVSREQQAAYFVRLTLVNLLNGLPVSIWYDWQDDGADPQQINDNFGLVAWDGQPKPACLAARTLMRELSGFYLRHRISLASDEDYVLLFTNGATSKLVAWTTGAVHAVSLPAAAPSLTVADMFGSVRTLPVVGSRATLQITGDPHYLTQ
jgi:hypothetical protein